MLEMLRFKDVVKATGYPRGSVYEQIKQRTFPSPVKMGARTAAWPRHEIEAILQARIAGANNEAIRLLVKELLDDRLTGCITNEQKHRKYSTANRQPDTCQQQRDS